jgi:cellulose synthase/poly-beta-1,6-N-acetylglucosamine synthase-like glycosyltransferase
MDALLLIADVLGWVLAVPVAIISLYMLAIVVGAWLYRPRPGPRAAAAGELPVVAVVVPAHDEERGIGATIAQLLALDYPAGRLRVFVIADNCSDRTAEVAAAAGAQVLVRNDEANRGKGQALDWMLRRQRALFEGAELIAFIDADMQVDRHFLTAMAATFADPGQLAAQGRYVIGNPDRSVFAAIGYVSFCYVNHVRPAGRCFWGGTADLKGSGMVFRAGFLLPRGWAAHSIAEDIQLGKELMLEGIRVAYVPAARVTSDIPTTLAQVRVQQSRWEGGKHQVHASVRPRAWRAFLRQPSALLLDGLLDLLVPPLSVVILLDLVGLALAWCAGSASLGVFGASLVIFGTALLTGLLQNRAPMGLWWRLLATPAFVAWKLVLLLRVALAPAAKGWQRTPRDPH